MPLPGSRTLICHLNHVTRLILDMKTCCPPWQMAIFGNSQFSSQKDVILGTPEK